MKRRIHLILVFVALAVALQTQGTLLAEGTDTPAATSPGHPQLPPPPPAGDGPRHHGKGDRMPPPVRHYFTQLKQENPEEYERLLKLRMEDRDQFMKEMAKRLPRKENPAEDKFRELDQKCWSLAEQLRATPPPENAEEIRAQLDALVADSVDSMIQQTKDRLEEIQARLTQMERLRDRIVQQRLDFYLQAPRKPAPPQKE